MTTGASGVKCESRRGRVNSARVRGLLRGPTSRQVIDSARYPTGAKVGRKADREPDNALGRVRGQRWDTPDNEKWSGRWESNPHGRSFRSLKASALAR